MNENDIPRSGAICCRTSRPLMSGEVCFSALIEGVSGLERLDFSDSAWRREPKAPFIGWWRYSIPTLNEKKIRLASNDILLELFDQWLGDESRSEYLYILTLLMIRRRVLRFEKEELSDSSPPLSSLSPKGVADGTLPDGISDLPHRERVLSVFSPRRETSFAIPIVKLDEERIAEVQNTLAELIYTGATIKKGYAA